MSSIDAVEIEVFRHLFAAIAEEMGVRLMRSAYSPNIKERLDYSCAIFDAAGDMVAQAAHIPVHLGSAGASVRAVCAHFDPKQMQPDDRFILNDPFAGGTHLPDITAIAPFFGPGDDHPRFYVANRAHHADVGGLSAGSMPMSRTIDEEGMRLGPSRFDAQTCEIICSQSRTPDERQGDLMAQSASLNAGLDRLNALCADHGAETLTSRAAALQNYTERLMRSIIQTIPDGIYEFTDHLDDDGFGTSPIEIHCAICVKNDQALFDFSNSAKQVTGPVNAVRAITRSAVMYAMRCLAPTELPSNDGLMRPLSLRTQPGTVVDAVYPAAVAAGNVETSQRLVDVIFGALAQAIPERIPAASCGSMNNLTLGGQDTRHPHAPSFAYYETMGGGHGAGPSGHGASGMQTHMTNTLNTPIEALEHAYPFRIETYAIRSGSGGDGKHQGGNGLIRRYRFEAPTTFTLLTERRTHGPWGLSGGSDGSPGLNTLHHADGNAEILPGKCTHSADADDALEIQTPGGGGWGSSSRAVDPKKQPR